MVCGAVGAAAPVCGYVVADTVCPEFCLHHQDLAADKEDLVHRLDVA